jgi:DtxR family transcriptional regulator, iron-dependent repressor
MDLTRVSTREKQASSRSSGRRILLPVATRSADTHGTDDYLEAVYEMHEEGADVHQARLAERLGVSRAAVSEKIGRLSRMKLVEVDEERVIQLTAHGRSVAEDAVRRHRMAERFLIDVLKLPWHKAHEEAERFQDAISEAVEERIMAMLGGPATCPHGNPIPGTGATLNRNLRPLEEFVEGDEVVLERLTEDVELHTDVLRYFEEHGLMPGYRIAVRGVAPDGTMSLEVDGTRSTLGPELADNLWVRPVARSRRASARR